MYNLDSHKLHLHPELVLRLLGGHTVYPLTVELSATSHCNQRCVYCAFDYEERHLSMSKEDLLAIEDGLAASGTFDNRTRALTLSGEGEPTLSPTLSIVAHRARKHDLHVGLMTNGTFDDTKRFLSECAWIRFSVNGFTKETYEKVHGKDNHDQVFQTITETLRWRNINHYRCTVAIQLVLLEANYAEVYDFACWARDLGVDYFVVKPVSCHPQQVDVLTSPKMAPEDQLKLEALSTKQFVAVYRRNAFEADEKPYVGCLAAPFFHVVASDCRVYPCAQWIGLDDWCLGHLKYQSWSEIIYSERRKRIMTHLRKELDVGTCRHPCRLDAANRYLWKLNALGPHDYFI